MSGLIRPSKEDGITLQAEKGCQLLELACTLNECAQIKAQGKALRVLGREMRAGKAARWAADELVTRAERRIGEITAEMEKAPGNQHTLLCRDSRQSKTEQLAEHGISKQDASEFEQLASIPEPEFKEITTELKSEGKGPTRGRILDKKRARSGRPSKAASTVLQRTLQSLKALPDEDLLSLVEHIPEHRLITIQKLITARLSAPKLEIVK